MSWLDRLRGGFSKTAARLGDNIAGLTSTAALAGFLHPAVTSQIGGSPFRRASSG